MSAAAVSRAPAPPASSARPRLETVEERQARLAVDALQAEVARLRLILATARKALRRLGEVASRGTCAEVQAAWPPWGAAEKAYRAACAERARGEVA